MYRTLDTLQLEELNCKVCQEAFGNNSLTPRVLHCGHTFCTGCLKTVIRERPYCPDCRLSIKTKDVNSLPIAYIVKQIIESIKDINKKTIERGVDYLDEDCNFYEAHSPVSLSRDNTFPSVGTCPLHSAPQQFWCSTCCLWICGSCAYLDHSKNSNEEQCEILSACKHFKTLKNKQIERVNIQIVELKNAIISVENFNKLVNNEIETLKQGQCNNNFDGNLLDKYKDVLKALANKSIELEASLDIIEDLKEKFNIKTLKQYHKASKHLDSLWNCKNFPRSEDELIEGVFTHIFNKVPFLLLAKGSSIAVSIKREGKRLFSPLKFENNEIIVPSLRGANCGLSGSHVFPFQEIKNRSKSNRKAFMRLSRQGTKLGVVEISLLDNRLSDQFAMLCTGEKGPSYKWTKFFASGGLFKRFIAGGDYEKNNGEGGAQIVENIDEPQLVCMEDGLVCGDGSYNPALMAQFKIFYKVGSSPFARCPIGKVIKGLPLLVEIANGDLSRVYIEECGIIVPMESEC